MDQRFRLSGLETTRRSPATLAASVAAKGYFSHSYVDSLQRGGRDSARFKHTHTYSYRDRQERTDKLTFGHDRTCASVLGAMTRLIKRVRDLFVYTNVLRACCFRKEVQLAQFFSS